MINLQQLCKCARFLTGGDIFTIMGLAGSIQVGGQVI